jgi:hypothetical protein
MNASHFISVISEMMRKFILWLSLMLD